MNTHRRHLSLWIGLALLLTACAEKGGPSLAECNRESCADACLDLAGSGCDVLSPSCQRRIFEAVSCVRGRGGDLPDIRTLTEDEVREERAPGTELDGGADSPAEAGADASLGDPSSPPGEAFYEDTALRLLGLRIPESSTDNVDYTGGYYDPSDGRITLIDRGNPQDTDSAQLLLAHELVHALQDQHMGFWELHRSMGTSNDAILAFGCLVEGEADLYKELAWTLLSGLSIDQPYLDTSLENQLKYSRDSVLKADSPYDQLWLLRYSVGARYLTDAWLAGGNWAVQSLYEAPPTSTIYWMHGFADSQERTRPLTQVLACNLATKPKGFERAWSDTLGAFTLFAFLGHNLIEGGLYPSEESWRRALSWRQDHIEVFSGPKGETALSWRIRFAGSDVAHEVAAELRAHESLRVRVKQHGAEIEVFTSDSRAAISAWRGTDPKACPIED